MQNSIKICNSEITVKEYQGKRVVTLKDIDACHQRPEGTAKRNFAHNRKHLIEGEDYLVRNSSEAKNTFGITAPNGLTLITESGYLMLVKSFTDDLAWEVQRNLVNNYFRRKDAEIDLAEVFGKIDFEQLKKVFEIENIKKKLSKYESLFVDVAGYRDAYSESKSYHLKKYEENKVEERRLSKSLNDLKVMIHSLRNSLKLLQ
jgi:hypothetical protein